MYLDLATYLQKVHPEAKIEVTTDFFMGNVYVPWHVGGIPEKVLPEVDAFLYAYILGHNTGYAGAMKRAAKEYEKNIHEVSTAMYAAGFEQGKQEGFEEGNENGFALGINAEWGESIIPSNAYDVEVFAVKHSQDFESGKQAFIGYKFDLDGQPQFHFVQVQFSAPNLTIKPKINEQKQIAACKNEGDFCEKVQCH